MTLDGAYFAAMLSASGVGIPGAERLADYAGGAREAWRADAGTLQHHLSEKAARALLALRAEKPGLPEEIAEVMGITPDKVREIIKVAQDPVSLETPIGEEEDSHLGDFIQDDRTLSPAEAAAALLMRERLMDVLDTLAPREKKVLILRFGLEDGRPRTLEEVGQIFHVTRERIRQIEAKALRKLRQPNRSSQFQDYQYNE